MTKTLGESLKTKKESTVLIKIADLCCTLVRNNRFAGAPSTQKANEELCLLCMVGCIALYDRATKDGAFGSKSFKTKEICKSLATYPTRVPDQKDLCENLRNVIRYGAKSYV